MRIGFYTNIRAGDNSIFGSGVARCLQPALGLERYGQQQCFVPDDVSISKDGALGGLYNDGTTVEFDVVVHSCWMAEQAPDLIKNARKLGQRVYADIDDWFWGLSQGQQAFYATHPKTSPHANLNHYRKILQASDGIICSTPFLVDRMRSYNSNVYLARNMIDLENIDWERPKSSERATIGWIGHTNTRAGDLNELAGVLEPFLTKHNLAFHHSGTLLGHRSFKDVTGLSDNVDITTSETTRYRDYPELFQPIDILLVPLATVPFNQAKSYIRQLEASATLTPYVVSSLPEQLEYKGGIKAKRPIDWIRALEFLLDEDNRKIEIAKNKTEVQRYDISQMWSQWSFLYE